MSKNTSIIVIEKKPETTQDKVWVKDVEKRYNTLFGADRVKFYDIGLEGLLEMWDIFDFS